MASTTAFAQKIYISDAGNFNKPPWQILEFDSTGKNGKVYIKDSLNWPQDILFLEDRNEVLISNLGSGKICIHDAETGKYLGDFADGIHGPTRIKIGPDSLLYVLQWSGLGRVLQYDLAGNRLGSFTKVGVTQSIGIDWDKAGNMYVSSYKNGAVHRFDKKGNAMPVFIDSNLLGPTNIWFNAAGELMVLDYRGKAIKRFDANGKYLGVWASGVAKSEGYAYLTDGSILVGDGGSSAVLQFDAKGNKIREFITPTRKGLMNPNAVVVRYSE